MELTKDDWQWLKQECINFIQSKLNHHDLIKESLELRRSAYKKGFTVEHVSKSIRKVRNMIDAKQIQPEKKPDIKEATPEPTPPPPAPALDPRNAARTTKRYYEPPTEQRQSMILDMADEKKLARKIAP